MIIAPESFAQLPVFGKRDHLVKALRKSDYKSGLIAECGVFMGGSIRLIADIVKPQPVHGFDSWEGLPEDWHIGEDIIRRKGHFSLPDCDRPKLPPNVQMHIGWFNVTLPIFRDEQQDNSISFLHVDCDLYSSAITVLVALNRMLKPGTVIVFDELCNWEGGPGLYTHYRDGELRALNQWCVDFSRYVEPLYRADDYAASVIIKQ